ncbi:MAG: hypothetical protein AB1449_13945 [Chloroflexota bacterium]
MPRPRTHIETHFIEGRACAICGSSGLKVVHLAGVPDHVSCRACGSAFVVEEGGERVMYGKIPAHYPLTRRFALRQWAWLEAIERKAEEERGAAPAEAPGLAAEAPPAPAPPPKPRLPDWLARPESAAPGSVEPVPPPQPPSEAAQLPDWLSVAEEPSTEPSPPATFLERAQIRRTARAAPAAVPPQPTPPAPVPSAPARPAAPAVQPAFVERVGEPAPGERYRVIVKGERVAFPSKVCAHCLRSPAPARLAVVGTWSGETPGRRRSATFTLHLCDNCRRRASARSEAEKTARLQAHLVSALIALGLLVGFLAIGLVDVRGDLLVAGLIITILLALGYSLPAILLLGRVARMPPPPDAVYVRTTLIIPPNSTDLETGFEWRNRHYAELFYQANLERITGAITPIKDRTAAAPS